MAYKMSLILSMVFVFMIFALGGDILVVQMIYSNLDSVSMTAGYLISKEGTIDSAKNFVESQNLIFTCETSGYLRYGDVVFYHVSKKYQPLVMKNEAMTIDVRRSAIVSFYG